MFSHWTQIVVAISLTAYLIPFIVIMIVVRHRIGASAAGHAIAWRQR
jgi:hypothetical protein